jgi:hypothetical protein
VCYRTAAFCCASFFFCGQKDPVQRIFIKKCFLFTMGSVCSVGRFTTGSRSSLKDVRKSQTMPDQVRKWLRQQSKRLLCRGFRRDGTSVSVLVEDMSRNNCFFSSLEYHMFYVLYPFMAYILTLPLLLFKRSDATEINSTPNFLRLSLRSRYLS